MKQLSWDDFKLVKTIADCKGMAGAAKNLKVNHSTVFRQLSQVEKNLGVALFERHRNGYELTPAGEEMTSLAQRMDDDVANFTRKLAGQEMAPAGELRITTNDVLLTHLLAPLLARYGKQYPDIRLDIVLANQALSLSKRDADVAIRATDSPPEALVGRRIADLAWALYGHVSDFPQEAKAPEMAELYQSRWVAFSEGFSASRTARFIHERVSTERIALKLNTVLGLTEAIENQIGIGPLPCFIGDTHLKLVRLTPPLPEIASSLWLLTHPDLRHSVRVRSFMDFMAIELTRMRRLIEGTP